MTSLKHAHRFCDGISMTNNKSYYGVICDDLFAFARDKAVAQRVDVELDEAYVGVGLERHTKKRVAGELEGEVAGFDFNGLGWFHPI